jgi:molecular chaperone HtpG
MILGLREYEGIPLQNVADSDLEFPEPPKGDEEDHETSPSLSEESLTRLIGKFKEVLGDKVSDVRKTDRLSNSVARLVDPEGSLGQEMQRVYMMMDREFQIPKKVLEINPSHPLLLKLSDLQDGNELAGIVVEQIFDSTLLLEGLHPDPSSMIPRIQKLMEGAISAENITDNK